MPGKRELQQIIENFLSGNSREYRIIKNRIAQYVYHQRFGSDIDRDDLVSEILVILLGCFRQGRFRGDSVQALNVFIYNTIRNKIFRTIYCRSKDQTILSHFQSETPDQRGTDEATADRQLVERIYTKLDVQCRDLLWLKFHRHWSDQEIATHMNKTKNAVSTAICRCLGKARQLTIIKELE